MKAKDFEVLVRRMRTAQKRYYKLDPRTDLVLKTEALVTAKQLEREVDLATIEDPANLETPFPREEETELVEFSKAIEGQGLGGVD